MRTTLAALLLVPALALATPPAPHAPRPPGPPALAPEAPPHVIDAIREQEAEILAWVEEHDPDSYRRLSRLKQVDPRGYLGQLVRVSRIMDRSDQDPDVVQRHKQMRKLERQIGELTADYADLDSKEQKARKDEVRDAVAELFELRQQERRSQLEAITLAMEALRAEIEEREADRKRIIEEFVEDQLREQVDL